MKRSLTLACTIAAAMTALPAFSAQSRPPSAHRPAAARPQAVTAKVAVIAFNAAVMQTNEGQRNLAQLQTKYAPQVAELKSQNDEIQTLKTQLQNTGASLSDVERANRQRIIDEKTEKLQRDAQDDQNDESSDMSDMYNALAQKVFTVLAAYAQDHGYTLVLDDTARQNTQSPILWFSQSTDITRAIIDAYNAKSGVPPPPATSAAPAVPNAPRPAARPGAGAEPK